MNKRNYLKLIFYYFYPIIYISIEISKEKKLPRQTFEEIKSKWLNYITNNSITEDRIEKISNDIYVSHDSGIAKIENKAAALLSGMGFPIALLTIVLTSNALKNSSLSYFTIIIFTIAIIEMIVSTIASGFAFKVGTRNITTLGDLKKFLVKTSDIKDWAATQLANVEMNNWSWNIKAYWLDAGQRHFERGIIFTSIGLLLLLAILFFLPSNIAINEKLVENIFINDTLRAFK